MASNIDFALSTILTLTVRSYEKQPRGLMFNFAFGGPKDYKKTEFQVVMMNEGKVTTTAKENLRTAVGVVAVIDLIALIIGNNDDDIVTTGLPPGPDTPPEIDPVSVLDDESVRVSR